MSGIDRWPIINLKIKNVLRYNFLPLWKIEKK